MSDANTDGTWKSLDYMRPWRDSPSLKRRRLFSKGTPPSGASMEVESFSHSPKSARLTEIVKQLSVAESQDMYKVMESICGEYLKDVEENLSKAIETDSCRAEMDVLNAEVKFLRKVATEKNVQLGAVNKMLNIKTAEVQVKDSEIAKKDREIECLKQEVATLQSMNDLIQKHGEDRAATLRLVTARLRSWLETM